MHKRQKGEYGNLRTFYIPIKKDEHGDHLCYEVWTAPSTIEISLHNVWYHSYVILLEGIISIRPRDMCQ